MKNNTKQTSKKKSTKTGKQYKSSAGYIFYRDDYEWTLDKNVSVNMHPLKTSLDESLLPGCLDMLMSM